MSGDVQPSAEMNQELKLRLMTSLARRAGDLAKCADLGAPRPVLALMAVNVTTTLILLLGRDFAAAFFHRMMTAYADTLGICICGKNEVVESLGLCRDCDKQLEADDNDAEVQLALLERPTRGRPS